MICNYCGQETQQQDICINCGNNPKGENERSTEHKIEDSNQVITEQITQGNKSLPIDERINIVLKLLKKDEISPDKTFLPDDDFYSQWDRSGDALRLMASRIFGWLKIIPENLFIDFHDQMEPPGIYSSDKSNSGILINSQHRFNQFQCAAILAHEIMHYYLMGRHGTVLDDNLQNEQMTDLATIYSGLGVLIINGFYHYSGWHETIIALSFGSLRTHEEKLSFGYFSPEKYGEHFYRHLRDSNQNYKAICSMVLPHARYFLPTSARIVVGGSLRSQKPQYIKNAEKSGNKDLLKRIGLILVMVPIGLTFLAIRFGGIGFVQDMFSDTKSTSDLSSSEQAEVGELKPAIDSLKTQYDKCTSELNTKISEIDKINNQMDNMKSSGNIDGYNSLVPKQNAMVKDSDVKRAECVSFYNQYNGKVNEYNVIIKK